MPLPLSTPSAGLNQALRDGAGTLLRRTRSLRSEVQSWTAQDLVRAELRVEFDVLWRHHVFVEHDGAPAADAAPERAQAVRGCGAVPGEPAALALGRRLAALVQLALSVPSPCSRAFEVFCAAGSVLASDLPGACAYG